ncbi:MAG TPA: hypothetical protein VMI54_01390 [Polyangiaceae bacterium]|nr:hypothetical protein [Polyangiaceae bacterium]
MSSCSELFRTRAARWPGGVSAPACVAAVWFALALAMMLWARGLEPIAFFTPDEAVNRLAGELIAKTGRPFLELPFPDPENAAHPRLWFSLGHYAVPLYPPVSLFAYGLLTYLGTFGLLLLVLFVASGVAAFAAGTARLLPPGRRLLGVFAPALASPALYWVLRPWMNISLFLVCIGWAVYSWARWRESERVGWLDATFACVGAAAAIRPDYTAYLLLTTLALGAAAKPSAWRRLLLGAVAAGAGAVCLNLPLNYVVTGHAFRAAYQLVLDPEQGAHPSPFWLRFLRILLFPMDPPPLDEFWRVFVRYWLNPRSVAFLALGQLAWIPIWRRQSKLGRWLSLAALVLLVVFMSSRMDPDTFGARRPVAQLDDSIPRYWTPVYWLAVIAPLLLVARAARRWVMWGGAACLAAVAALCLHDAWITPIQSILDEHSLTLTTPRRFEDLARRLRKRAIVYARPYDKLLWSRFLTGNLEEANATAASMLRAHRHHFTPYLYVDGFQKDAVETIRQKLAEEHCVLVTDSARMRLYHLERERDDAP